MEPRLVALKLFLEELEIPSNIDTVDDRKRVQKGIYLGQLTEVDLGYRFGWYLMGPYSTALTRDYYSMAESLSEDIGNFELHETAKERLGRIKPLLTPPQGVDLQQEDWLELVASFHYLRTVSKYNQEKTVNILNEQKPRLAPYADFAKEALHRVHLLN
jgi:uncharacterized protein YwgA